MINAAPLRDLFTVYEIVISNDDWYKYRKWVSSSFFGWFLPLNSVGPGLMLA
jgi:hypothetical protein